MATTDVAQSDGNVEVTESAMEHLTNKEKEIQDKPRDNGGLWAVDFGPTKITLG